MAGTRLHAFKRQGHERVGIEGGGETGGKKGLEHRPEPVRTSESRLEEAVMDGNVINQSSLIY